MRSDGGSCPGRPSGVDRESSSRVQSGPVVENVILEPGECGSRLEAEFGGEVRAGAFVGVQGVGLASGAVEREHQLSGQVFSVGMLETEDKELVNELIVAAELKIGVDAGF